MTHKQNITAHTQSDHYYLKISVTVLAHFPFIWMQLVSAFIWTEKRCNLTQYLTLSIQVKAFTAQTLHPIPFKTASGQPVDGGGLMWVPSWNGWVRKRGHLVVILWAWRADESLAGCQCIPAVCFPSWSVSAPTMILSEKQQRRTIKLPLWKSAWCSAFSPCYNSQWTIVTLVSTALQYKSPQVGRLVTGF